MRHPWPNHALQRTAGRHGCKWRASWPPSLSLGRSALRGMCVRKLSFDQWEFDSPDSEQSLDLALAARREYPDMAAFLAACGTDSAGLSPTRPLASVPRAGMVADH